MARTQNMPDFLTDPVDWARHYWGHHRIDGDEQRFLTLMSMLRYQRMVTNDVDAELKAHGLTLADYLVLMTLQLSETGTQPMSSLARSLLIPATTATLATDRLHARGLVQRSAYSPNRTATRVTISEWGRENAHKATLSLSARDFGMYGSSAAEVHDLRSALTAMRQAAGDA